MNNSLGVGVGLNHYYVSSYTNKKICSLGLYFLFQIFLIIITKYIILQASRQFSLTVETPKVELPLIERFPNTSVSLGKSATLVCEVRSNLTPEIQWLRRTADSQFSISIGDMLLVHAGEGQIERQGQYMYTSTLAIPAVVEGNSGLYVCLATNSAGGFNYKTAELSITNPQDNKTPPLVLYLVIGKDLDMVNLFLKIHIFQNFENSVHSQTYLAT